MENREKRREAARTPKRNYFNSDPHFTVTFDFFHYITSESDPDVIQFQKKYFFYLSSVQMFDKTIRSHSAIVCRQQ